MVALSFWKHSWAIILLCGCALALTGCSKHANLGAGRLYYTVDEVGCTRIEWTDVEGLESHHVLGVLPQRDEFSDRNVNADTNEALARNSKYVHSPCISDDGQHMLCLYGKHPSICLFNLVTGQQEGSVSATGTIYNPVFGENNKQIIYYRLTDDQRYHLYVQDYPKAPKEILKTRTIEGVVYNSIDKYIYYSDVYPDGYIALRRCRPDGSDASDVRMGVLWPIFPRIGHEMAGIIEGQLAVYDFYSKSKDVLDSQQGVCSPCWSPLGTDLAYVRNGNIYTVVRGNEPVKVPTGDKKVVDVFWGKGID